MTQMCPHLYQSLNYSVPSVSESGTLKLTHRIMKTSRIPGLCSFNPFLWFSLGLCVLCTRPSISHCELQPLYVQLHLITLHHSPYHHHLVSLLPPSPLWRDVPLNSLVVSQWLQVQLSLVMGLHHPHTPLPTPTVTATAFNVMTHVPISSHLIPPHPSSHISLASLLPPSLLWRNSFMHSLVDSQWLQDTSYPAQSCGNL